MPDLLTHAIVGWIIGKTTKMKVGLVVIGSLIPDLMRITLAFEWFDVNHQNLFDPLGTPIGTFLIGGLIALFFEDVKKAFMALGIGIISHFILDLLLIQPGGIKFLFPFSWEELSYYNLIYAGDYQVTIIAVLAAILIYIIYFYHDKRKNQKKQRI